MHFRSGEAADLLAQLFDVGTLLADHHARTSRVDGDAALLVRTLDDDLGHSGSLELLHEELADRQVLVEQRTVLVLAGEPARIPGTVDAEPQADWIDFVAHQAVSSTSRTTMVRLENALWIVPTRPRARGEKRFMTSALPT